MGSFTLLLIALCGASMVHLQLVDAIAANVTNNTFAHKFNQTDYLFGLQQFEYILKYPACNGKNWTLSIQTADIAAVAIIITVLTFGIDHYLLKSRNLVRIGGTLKVKNHTVALDEEASIDEKTPLAVEPKQKPSNDEDSEVEIDSEHSSDSPKPKTRLGYGSDFIWIVTILFFFAMSGGKKKDSLSGSYKETVESSTKKAEVEGEADKYSRTSLWGKVAQHPWSRATSSWTTVFLLSSTMLFVFTYELLFWPWLFALLVISQLAYYSELNPSATVQWQSTAVVSTLYLSIWTIVGMTLLLKPNRFQYTLWKSFKWTRAVNFWLFWIPFETYFIGSFIAKRFGFQHTGTMLEVFFFLRPSLLAYVSSGVVLDAVVALRINQYFWHRSRDS